MIRDSASLLSFSSFYQVHVPSLLWSSLCLVNCPYNGYYFKDFLPFLSENVLQPQLFHRITTLTFHYQPFILLLVIAASCWPSCNSRISITGFSDWTSLNLKKKFSTWAPSFQVLFLKRACFIITEPNSPKSTNWIVKQKHNLITDVPSLVNPR